MNDASLDFDWVSSRNECSISKMFERLRFDIKTDVEKRQQLRERHPQLGFLNDFSFISKSNKLSVLAQTDGQDRRSIVFSLRGEYIFVLDENDTELFRATVTLNNQKQCVLMVDKEELEEWQFRKKALDAIFFANVKGDHH
ncbi:MAG TPA: hypothetical protein VFK06_04970 [Candidatus Angelobacter sp.]|nr:hypothetical protein [Candidatus Angelobacter sp.]